MDKEEFIQWAMPLVEEFEIRYPSEVASVDRIDPDGHYEFSNMRIISMRENSLRSRLFMKHVGITTDSRSPEAAKANLVRALRVWMVELGMTFEEFNEAWKEGDTER